MRLKGDFFRWPGAFARAAADLPRRPLLKDVLFSFFAMSIPPIEKAPIKEAYVWMLGLEVRWSGP